MLELFREHVSLEEKKLAAEVKRRGGKAALNNEKSMEKLAAKEAALSNEQSMEELAVEEADPNTPLVLDNRHTGSPSFDLAKLQEEIDETPDQAIEKNAEFFSSKLELHRRHMMEDIRRVVHRGGDRVISAVTAGPHDRIVDPVWREDFCVCGMN